MCGPSSIKTFYHILWTQQWISSFIIASQFFSIYFYYYYYSLTSSSSVLFFLLFFNTHAHFFSSDRNISAGHFFIIIFTNFTNMNTTDDTTELDILEKKCPEVAPEDITSGEEKKPKRRRQMRNDYTIYYKNRKKRFPCKFCQEYFSVPQALGGHVSKSHPNQSKIYKEKKQIRIKRELERNLLLRAK